MTAYADVYLIFVILILQATVDRRSNMVKLSMEANYNDKYHGFFNARLLLPYIDFMALMTIIPKLLLHTFELQNKEFWTLSEAVTLFSVILMKSITEEQWQVFRSLVQSFPTRGSKLETSFPEKLITTLKREKYTSKYLEELTQTRKNNPMPILEAAQGIIRSLPQNRQIMLCRAVFQAYVARKVQLVGFELASSKANMKKTASLLLTDGYILVDNDEFYDLKWVNEAAPQLASKGKNLEQDQMRSENDVNSALNINVLVPNALPADNQATCDFLEDFAANAEFYDSIDDVSEEYHQKIAMSSPPAKSLKMTDADDLVPNVKTSMKDVIVVPRPPVADVSAKQNIETTANANGQKTADSRPKRLMTTSHPPRPLLQQPQPSPYRLPPPPPTASVPLQQLHLPPTHANQLMQHQQPFQCQVQVESQQQQPRQYQQQQRPIYHQPLQAQQTQQQLYHIGLPAAPQPPPSFAAHYQPFRQPAANFYPSPLYTAHCQQHGGYSPCPQTMMTPIQQSAVSLS